MQRFLRLKSIVFVRYTGMIALTFFISHYLSYQKLPFSNGYSFPLRTFLIVLLFGIFICETNAFIYRYLKETHLYKESLQKIIVKQFTYSALGTTIVFAVLFITINNIVFGNPFNPLSFAKYLSICIVVALFEDVLITFKDVQKLFRQKVDKDSRNGLKEIIVQHGGRSISFNPTSLAYLRSEGGVVTILDQNLQEYTTNFNSLNEIEEQLPPNDFFRINRQYFINRQVIKSIKKDKNRKLKVILEKPYQKEEVVEALNVSRYKSLPFKQWYLGQA